MFKALLNLILFVLRFFDQVQLNLKRTTNSDWQYLNPIQVCQQYQSADTQHWGHEQ